MVVVKSWGFFGLKGERGKEKREKKREKRKKRKEAGDEHGYLYRVFCYEKKKKKETTQVLSC